MKIVAQDMLKKLHKKEEVVVWATTITLVGEKWGNSPGSPHLSNTLKPTFGKISGSMEYDLKFHPEKANSAGFVKTGRNESGVTCFSTYDEAAEYYNKELQKFIKIKEKEIKEAEDLLSSPSL